MRLKMVTIHGRMKSSQAKEQSARKPRMVDLDILKVDLYNTDPPFSFIIVP